MNVTCILEETDMRALTTQFLAFLLAMVGANALAGANAPCSST